MPATRSVSFLPFALNPISTSRRIASYYLEIRRMSLFLAMSTLQAVEDLQRAYDACLDAGQPQEEAA
jgi:hypothetical protein